MWKQFNSGAVVVRFGAGMWRRSAAPKMTTDVGWEASRRRWDRGAAPGKLWLLWYFEAEVRGWQSAAWWRIGDTYLGT